MALIFAIEALRENCRWNDDGKCKYTNEQPSPECRSVCFNEHVATTDLLTRFMKSCPLIKE